MSMTLTTIDLRSPQDYIQGHLPGAVNLPLSDLSNLWHELPPKDTPLQLCVAHGDEASARQEFQQRHFVVNNVITDNDLANDSLETGATQNRAWQGNPILEQMPQLVAPVSDAPIAIDIGCGSGRDSLLMGLMGYQVIAVDVFADALARVEYSAQRWGLTIKTVAMDCRKHPEQLIALIQEFKPDLIMQSRFLHRPLFDIYEQYLVPGCKITIHTFLEGAAQFGSPKKADFLLKNEELAERFKHWSVLINQVHTLNDGRPLSMFVAQK